MKKYNFNKSEIEWKKKLSEEEFKILRKRVPKFHFLVNIIIILNLDFIIVRVAIVNCTRVKVNLKVIVAGQALTKILMGHLIILMTIHMV